MAHRPTVSVDIHYHPNQSLTLDARLKLPLDEGAAFKLRESGLAIPAEDIDDQAGFITWRLVAQSIADDMIESDVFYSYSVLKNGALRLSARPGRTTQQARAIIDRWVEADLKEWIDAVCRGLGINVDTRHIEVAVYSPENWLH